jgi:hypothetical protein
MLARLAGTSMHERSIVPQWVTPFPIFRAGTQSGGNGIHDRVVTASLEVILIPDKMIEGFALPELFPSSSEQPIGLECDIAFPSLQDAA